jgi:hypothetical protein
MAWSACAFVTVAYVVFGDEQAGVALVELVVVMWCITSMIVDGLAAYASYVKEYRERRE